MEAYGKDGCEIITDRKLIVTIAQLKDERLKKQVLEPRNCTLIEWVQFLETHIQRPNFLKIWGTVKDGMLKRYFVALNAVYPPLGREVVLLYQNYFGDINESGSHIGAQILEEVKKWGQELGAKKIHTFTKYPRVMSKFGFVEEKGSSVYIELDASDIPGDIED